MITLTQNLSSFRRVLLREYSLPLGVLIADPTAGGGVAPTPTTFYDSSVIESSDADTWNNWIADPLDGSQVVNLNPEIASLDPITNNLTRIQDGAGTVEFIQGSVKTSATYTIATTPGGESRDFVEYTAGTVARYLEDQMVTLINSDLSKRDLNYFSTIDHVTATYTKNPNCWARDVDMSALSIGTSHGSDSDYTTQRPGTLITPRHVVVANHYPPFDQTYRGRQDYLRFVTPSGDLRTVQVIGSSPATGDQKVLTLSNDVTGITPMKVGGDWLTQIVDTQYYAGGLVISLNKQRNMWLSLFGNPTEILLNSTLITYPGVDITGQKILNIYNDGIGESRHPTISANSDLTGLPVGGDSGSPSIVLVNGEPVVLTCWTTAYTGPCTWMGSGANELLNQMIIDSDADAGVSTGYTVTAATDPTI